ncbi:hypothetical protein MICRO8M_80265 [Microbacterium sp. 8M]|nr:hypothetical protein MICRO8M_80265 [Microbacterium sp. 8M]
MSVVALTLLDKDMRGHRHGEKHQHCAAAGEDEGGSAETATRGRSREPGEQAAGRRVQPRGEPRQST